MVLKDILQISLGVVDQSYFELQDKLKKYKKQANEISYEIDKYNTTIKVKKQIYKKYNLGENVKKS